MKEHLKDSPHAVLAMKNFRDGWNCSQSLFLAFSDVHGFDQSTAAKFSSAFGGGMGRLREVCGAVTGMFMVLGCVEGYDSPSDDDRKAVLYEHVQGLALEMETCCGSIICRELLGLDQKRESPIPEKRTESYYDVRPCEEIIGHAAVILEKFLLETNRII